MQNTQNQPIWNPSTVAGLSVMFTPAFGSYLNASNWNSLGQPERASASKAWFYVSLLILAAMAAAVFLAAKAGGDTDTVRGFINIGGLIYFFIWYVASGRKQVSYVKDGFGKTYAKKSLVKPVLAGLALAVLYAVVVFGLLIATNGLNDEDGQIADEGSSRSPSALLAGVFGGAAKLDCASKDVKEIITDNYAEQLADTGVPDLAMAIARERIKFRVEMITETLRNDQSHNVQCSGKLVVEFPKEDLVKAAQVKEAKIAEASIRGFRMPTDPMFSTTLTYLVSSPADKEEKQNGPIVKMTTRAGVKAGEGDFGPYIVAYTMLAYAAPDLTASSKNDRPWDKDWKTAAVEECGQHLNGHLCGCKMDQFEKLVSQEDMQRIGFSIQSNPLLAGKYPNFIAVSESLNKQCPLPQGVASVPAPAGSAAPSAVEEPAKPLGQAEASPSPVTQAAQTAQPAIVASFDCTKASSKIEKLVCSAPETGDADRRLASSYRTALAKSTDAATLKQQQRDWLKERNACEDAACLLKVTDSRIQALSAM
ncbi:lysozyme inhibitor LprI family protein [Cupriavidus sp. amp6]|uniref:lysozyme inhibitor LprI family protein n=1 Tax=Cupriavidus sp. amp6 TaxID=388051 RepID=UPI000419E4C7|nr:lysozyme inhibitor LprI family protein [Cupriavidus sp. amp6]